MGWLPIPRPTIVAGLLWVGAVLLTIVAEAIAMYRFPRGNGWPPQVRPSASPVLICVQPNEQNPPLPDYGFDWIPYRCFDVPHSKAALPDLLVIIVLLVTAVRFVLFDDRR